jgi:hypothetical protein
MKVCQDSQIPEPVFKPKILAATRRKISPSNYNGKKKENSTD